MTIKVRIQEHTNYGYNFKTMQVIEHPYKDSSTIEVLGFIQFTQFKDSEKFRSPKFQVDTDKFQNLLKMGKLCKYLKENSEWDADFEEVFSVLNCKEYKIFDGEFISSSDEGKRKYKLFTENGNYHKWFIAANDILADKIAIKSKVDNYKLESELIKFI